MRLTTLAYSGPESRLATFQSLSPFPLAYDTMCKLDHVTIDTGGHDTSSQRKQSREDFSSAPTKSEHIPERYQSSLRTTSNSLKTMNGSVPWPNAIGLFA
jgi:hypothetical protein